MRFLKHILILEMGGSGFAENIEYKEFDNFFNCNFIMNGYRWTSSEQAYQALKYEDKDHIERINRETDISLIYQLGQSKHHKLSENYDYSEKIYYDPFENKKIKLMYKVNLEKFSQNKALKDLLLRTKGPITFYKSSKFWRYWNGKILEKIRNII